MRAFEILNEMVVRHQDPGGEYVLAHRDSIWVFADGGAIPEPVLDDIEQRTGLEGNTFWDFQQLERPDVVTGSIHNNYFYRDGTDTMHPHPASSLILKKIVKHFDLEGVMFSETGVEDSEENEVPRWEMEGKIPEIMFHGTNSMHLNEIARAGIAPNHNANWPGVGKFYDRVFLTASLSYAMYHANRSATEASKHGEYGVVPLVVATRLPDRNLIDADFDVAGTFYGPDHERTDKAGYTDAMGAADAYGNKWNPHHKVSKHSPKTDWTRETGVISYKGRIPASFFKHFVVPGSAEHENTLTMQEGQQIDVSEIRKAVSVVQDFGYYDRYHDQFEDDEDQDDDRWDGQEDDEDR